MKAFILWNIAKGLRMRNGMRLRTKINTTCLPVRSQHNYEPGKKKKQNLYSIPQRRHNGWYFWPPACFSSATKTERPHRRHFSASGRVNDIFSLANYSHKGTHIKATPQFWKCNHSAILTKKNKIKYASVIFGAKSFKWGSAKGLMGVAVSMKQQKKSSF